MSRDNIKIRILPDGRLVATTGKISMKNHMEADKALAELTELLGGEAEIESTKKTDHHHHNHHEGHHDH